LIKFLPFAVAFVLACGGFAPVAFSASSKEVQEHGTAMLKDAEDMVMHGGMGDTKAILHHCREVTRHAQTILKLLPPSDPHGKEAAVHLQEAIRYCQRVESMGENIDPGAPLNPATKARAAVREAVKHLSALSDEGKH
jgi:hypothetical protein